RRLFTKRYNSNYNMTSKKTFKFQRTIYSTAEHCCVPLCQASSKYNSLLSFHTFPSDAEIRRKWLVAIRRDKFTVTPHTRVCSRHFNKDDVREPLSETGRRLLNKGAVPALERPPPMTEDDGDAGEKADIPMDHDYASASDPAVVDLALDDNMSLRDEILKLREHVEKLTMNQRFGIHRFAKHNANCFSFEQTRFLQPIDEMFMFLNYLALGSKQRDLADRYGVHQSTVSRIITTWSNFLYTVLGSVRIWIPEEKIRAHLPAEFKDYADTTVILDCTELRCQCPSSPLLQSEMFSAYKSHCTLKGLLGVAPHGAVTFISQLYAGSISDKQITRESGILSLLRPGMAIMVDRGFLVDDLVPCKIYRPAFLSGRSQMSACEVRETQAIARLRVHVERLIRRVKEHKFFDTEIPLRLFGNINQLYTVIVKNVSDLNNTCK
uniref:THAP-type domain-containing protein n=1 Tax=Oryzias latipes TaxID=8090 RepID=A0A3B3HWH9_ORYLA